MHQATILKCQWEKHLLEWIGVIIEQSQDTTDVSYKVVKKNAIYSCLNSIDQAG